MVVKLDFMNIKVIYESPLVGGYSPECVALVVPY